MTGIAATAEKKNEITATGEKKLLLFSGRAHPELTNEIAGCLGIEPTPTKLYDFANGEIFVRFLESVRGSDAFVMQSHTAPINQWIMEQLIMVDALKRASAKRITVVAPFFGYARQDKKSRGREPISARLMADLFATAGADRLMAVDLHTAQIQGFFDGPVDHLFALPILAGYLEGKLDLSQVTVVAPDAGRVRVCERWTDRLGCPLAIIHKRRDPDVANKVAMFEVVGHVRGRTCIVVDDMIDTGSTIIKAADALFSNDAIYADRALRTVILGKQAIGKYLTRVLATVPYGKGAKLVHIVGSDQGGGYEWVNADGPVKRGIVAIDLNSAGQIERLNTTWDNGVMSDTDLQALVLLSIEK